MEGDKRAPMTLPSRAPPFCGLFGEHLRGHNQRGIIRKP
jgi:hypothetical protein